MSKRTVLGVLAAFTTLAAAPAYASSPAPEAATGPDAAGGVVADLTPLASALPSDPILASALGASRSPASNIFWGALYGGLAGAVIGLGVALIEDDNWGRDIAIGAGAGIVVGAALGAANVFGSSRGPYPSRDGLGTPDRDPVIQARTVGLAGRF